MNEGERTILVGPTGFLGPAFLEIDGSVIAVGRSPLPEHLANEYIYIASDDDFSKLERVDFDKVIFLIGSSHHEVLNASASLAVEKNVIPLQKFLFWLKESGKPVKKIITFTTMLQYDTGKMVLPCDETQPLNPHTNNYVMSKFFAEQVSEQYRSYFDIIDVRISNVYGPTRLYRPDIVPSLIWSLLERNEATVWTKKPRRDFIYVEDAVNAVFKLLNSSYSGVVNLGTGVASSVGELTSILSQLSGVDISEEYREVTGHMEYRHDIKLLRSIIGNFEPVSLRAGLEKTYKIMETYYNERN